MVERKVPFWRRAIAHVVVVFGALWTLVPLYWLFITAFKSWHEMHARPPTVVPQNWVLTGFQQALAQGGKGIVDSTIVALGTLLLSLLVGLPAAYGLSRFQRENRNLAFGILAFRFLPPIAMAVAFYITAVRLHIIDTHLLLILANAVFNVPFVVWIMKGFFDEIPYAIEEAAHIDGATWWKAFYDHVLPLTLPGLIAVGLFVVVFTWNELIFAMLLTGPDVLPFTRVVPGLWVGRKYLLQPNWPAISALGVLNVAGVLLMGSYLQKYLVRAMTYGAVHEAVWE
jgi:multiple sugar transport system permease protein